MTPGPPGNATCIGGSVGVGMMGVGSHLHSSSSSSSSSSTNTIANITHSFHSLKTSSSLHDGSLIRSESIGSTASSGSAGAGLMHLRSPNLQYPPVMMCADSAPSLVAGCLGGAGTPLTNEEVCLMDTNLKSAKGLSVQGEVKAEEDVLGGGGGLGLEEAGGGGASKTATSSKDNGSSGHQPKISANVLNDIGNMLANLTDELDAMLEEEKRAGLNIDSE